MIGTWGENGHNKGNFMLTEQRIKPGEEYKEECENGHKLKQYFKPRD
jgi:hypothetical protein